MNRTLPLAVLLMLVFSSVPGASPQLLAQASPEKRPQAVRSPGPYLVLVQPGKYDEFLPAANALAALHGAAVKRFDPRNLDATLAELRQAPPRYVAFVMPPEEIDVDFSHQILMMATRVDDDPFVDFSYGFITGRDGAAALQFVQRIEAAWKRDFGNKAAIFGSWEGLFLPFFRQLTSFEALGFSGRDHYVKTRDAEATRRKTAQEALASIKGSDVLLFFSHGYPDSMESCFRAKDLKEWQTDLAPAILFNCACYNGAPGRWFAPGAKGVEDRGIVSRDDSVALALLDSGIAGYFAGIDPWHGPLTMQVLQHVIDDGLSLGDAAKCMFDRLALDFLPERIAFEPTLKNRQRFLGEGTVNRRHNGAGMIFYGDPALAPFARTAKHLLTAEVKGTGQDQLRIKLTVQPLVKGMPGTDFMLPMNRLTDYYSVKTVNFEKELALELYRVVPLPRESSGTPKLQVASARSADKDVSTGPPQLGVENTLDGRLLHIRVPLLVRALDMVQVSGLVTKGLVIELVEESRMK